MIPWEQEVINHIAEKGDIRTSEAASLWNTSARTARSRLKSLVERGDLAVIGTGPNDPNRKYVLKS